MHLTDTMDKPQFEIKFPKNTQNVLRQRLSTEPQFIRDTNLNLERVKTDL